MSVTTQLQIRSLARDPSGHLASQAGAMRRAENVVIRAPGVAESRPSFDLYLEKMAATPLRVRGLYEFDGAPVCLEYNGSTGFWGLRNLATNTVYTAPTGVQTADVGKPIDYDQTEACFAEARQSVYFSTYRGVYKIDAASNTTSGLDMAGVEMATATDWLTANINLGLQSYSWAYSIVFVRKDANGYVRRSPPSERWCVTSSKAVIPALASRVYFPQKMRAGDKVELYRTRMATGDAPSPEMFLTHVHTITAAEVALAYYVPPYDEGNDDQLGAALYTSPSQGGALAARYTPPRAQVLEQFGGCMWYGRATNRARVALTLRSAGLGGPVRGAVSAGTGGGGLVGTFTAGSPTVTITTAGLVVGADFTDNIVFGSNFAGTYVPALTTILAVGATTITMSANALAGAPTNATCGMMSRYAPSGIATVVPDTLGGNSTLGSPILTGISSTANLRVGMGWTDSASGPAVASANFSADTRILSIDSGTQITLTKNALATTKAGSAYDCVEVATFPFYAWPGNTLLGANTPVWSWPLRCVPYWPEAMGLQSMASFVTNLATAVNYFSVKKGSSYRVRAIPAGDTNLDDKEVTSWSKSIVFEEYDAIGDGMVTFETGAVFTTPFTVVVSRPSAFESAIVTNTSSIDDKPNRLYWSDPDEPESVPLTNFVDVGAEQYPILALVSLTNALMVFTERGVYRVSGSAPDAWSVECLDDRLRLMRPEAVSVVDDVAYAWLDRGFYAIDRGGLRSISAGSLDVELRDLAAYIFGSAAHGAFVVTWPARQLVLFGVPGSLTATKTTRLYCYSLITQAWSEWPVEWGVAAESKEDNLYHSRATSSIVLYEVRSARDSVATGYDRLYTLTGNPLASGTTLTVAIADAGQWEPGVGDMASAATGGFTYYRRVTVVTVVGSDYVMTIESAYPSGVLTTWKAYETARAKVLLEWHPTAPAGIPTGAICREIQVQLDLRLAPTDASKQVSVPQYIIGGTSERDVTPYTLTSNRTRTLQMQPLRVGCSRQIARSAYIAPYFSMIDVFCLRVNGASIVWEGTSERTRR